MGAKPTTQKKRREGTARARKSPAEEEPKTGLTRCGKRGLVQMGPGARSAERTTVAGLVNRTLCEWAEQASSGLTTPPPPRTGS